MGGIPRNCFGSDSNVALWLFCIFLPYVTYVVNIALICIIGFIGMYLLVKNHFITDKKNDWIAVGVAICFAILPFYPPGGVFVSFNFGSYTQQFLQRPSMTHKQFFAESLFAQIKQDIGLPVDDYRVVNFCIHPSVAQYNGFYTIDGYMNSYPLEFKQ